MALFEVTEYDRQVYEEIRDFLPDKMIDIHTHVYRKPEGAGIEKQEGVVMWPRLVARDNSLEDIQETYRLMFPGKEVTPLMFSSGNMKGYLEEGNRYLEAASKITGYPALYFSTPDQGAEEIERNVLEGGFLGLKAYLSFAPAYIPAGEVRVLDFFPPHQLEVINKLGLIVMLHLPRNKRLKDPVNLAQILYIKERYPRIKLIVAHIGRAYCKEDVGSAFEELSVSEDLLFDFSANCNEWVMEKMLEAVGPDRIMFGSDLPILRMRTRRIEENGTYINLIPPGLYGDPKQDAHLREVSAEEAKHITFFMYEEIRAFRKAAEAVGLDKAAVEKAFYGNARKLLDEVRGNADAYRKISRQVRSGEKGEKK